MHDSVFKGVFDSELASVIAPRDFVFCVGCSLLLGALLALMYMYRSRYTQSFVVTLALLPAVVCVVIMMVNGNVGTGVAVAGAFSLVRFRSAPGTAKEIGVLFIAMGAGLIAGMGYLAYAALFVVILGGASMLYSQINFGSGRRFSRCRILRVTIPEDLNYTGVFDKVLSEYASQWELTQVKTTNMGSLFRLTYDVTLRSAACEKQLIDKLRCRNGNLEITVSRQEAAPAEL